MKITNGICFLVYQSRSGSTFLSRLLNENKHISVTPEADFNYAFAYKNIVLKNHLDISITVNEFFVSKKSKSWNFSKIELENELLNLSFPIKFSDFFNTILALHYCEQNRKAIIFKGVFPNKIPQLKKQFPKAKFILISRDFRAVYNSQEKTINFNTSKPMSKNPYLASLEYRLLNRFIEAYTQKECFQHVVYENLMDNQENVLAGIYDFVGVPNEQSEDGNYVEALSDEHKNIHTNVNKPAQKHRMEAWKDELDPVYISIVQSVAGKSLLKNAYSIEVIQLSFSQRIKKFRFLLEFLFQPNEIYVVFKDYFKIRFFSTYKMFDSE
tara:strand:- start:4047 stop:5024 length:978 start_codon:yes stop_codon:yes gene_type:complete